MQKTSCRSSAADVRRRHWWSAIPDASELLGLAAGVGSHVAAAPVLLHGFDGVADLRAASHEVVWRDGAAQLGLRAEHPLARFLTEAWCHGLEVADLSLQHHLAF